MLRIPGHPPGFPTRAPSLLSRHPALDIALPRTCHRESIFGHALGNGGSRCQKGVGFDLDRRNQVYIAANESPVSNPTSMFRVAIVIHHHGSAAEIHVFAHIGISDIGEMCGSTAPAQGRILDLDEVPNPDTTHQMRVRPQM